MLLLRTWALYVRRIEAKGWNEGIWNIPKETAYSTSQGAGQPAGSLFLLHSAWAQLEKTAPWEQRQCRLHWGWRIHLHPRVSGFPQPALSEVGKMLQFI